VSWNPFRTSSTASTKCFSNGAWGTMLPAKGLQSGDYCEEWNVFHPDAVRSMAATYAQAGTAQKVVN
jgi:methionine synthase I (cobalamin-dependent)